METSSEIRKILKIEVQYDKTIVELGKYKQELIDLKQKERDLKAAYASGALTLEEYGKRQSAIEQQTKALKFSYNDLGKAIQNQVKQENFAKGSLAGLRAELSKLTREYDQMSRVMRQGGEGIELARKINKITDEVKNAEKATQRFYRNVGNYKSALHGINGLTAGFRNAFSVLQSLMGGLGAVAFGRTIIQVARDFEDGMARVRAVSNPLESEFMALRDKAMELGRDTRYTATQVAEAMEELARKGFSATETLNTITPTLQLAQANTISMADAAQIASSTMRAFGMESNNMTHIADVLSATCANSATNMSLLGEAMKNAGPMAAVLKSDMRSANDVLHETVALIGGMANVGMTGSDAGTGVKQIVLDLASASRKGKKKSILEHYGIQLDEARLKAEGLIPVLKEMKKAGLGESAADLQQLFTRYSATRAANLINNIDQVETLQKTVSIAYGENERMFNQSLGNVSGAIFRMQSAWQDFMIRVAQSSEGFVTGPIEYITSAIKGLGAQINAVGMLVTSIFAAKMFMPALTKGLESFKNFYGLSQDLAAADLEKKQILYDAEKVKHQKLIQDKIRAEELLSAMRRRVDEQRAALDNLMIQREALITQEHINQARMRITTDVKEMNMRKQNMATYAAQRMELEAKISQQQEALNSAEALKDRAQDVVTKKMKDVGDHGLELAELDAGIEEATSKWSKFVGGVKSTGKGLLGVIKTLGKGLWSLAKSFAPMLIVTGIMEIIGAFYNARREAAAFEKKLDDIEKLRNGEQVQNSAIVNQLEQLQSKLNDINDGHKKTQEELALEQEYIDAVNGLLGKEYETYDQINGELPDIIKQLKEQARVQAAQNILAEEYAKIMRIANDRNLKFTSEEDLAAQLQSIRDRRSTIKNLVTDIGAWFGGSNLSSDIEDVSNAITAITNIEKSGVLNADQIARAKANADKSDPSNTPSGQYNPADGLNGGKKTGKKTGSDPKKTLEDLYNNWKKKLLDLETENIADPFVQARKRLDAELEKLNLDAAKALNLEDNSRLAKAAKAYPETWELITQTVGQVIKEEQKKISLEISKLVLDRNEKLLDREISYYDLANSVIASKLAERNSMEGKEYADELAMRIKSGKNVLSATKDIYEERVKLLKEQSVIEETIALKSYEKEKNSLMKAFANQELGKGTTKYTGSMEDMQAGYMEYKDKREALERLREEGTMSEEAYNMRLAQLNEEYSAEADYYARLQLLEEKYNLDSQERERQHMRDVLDLKRKMYDESLRIVQQGIANEFNAKLLGYEQDTAKAGQHNYNLAQMDEQQWQNLQQRIGARDAIELQNEWEQYQAELANFNQHSADMYQSEEEKEARRIELARKGADIQVRANESIQASDEARYEAASKIAGGLQSLIEAVGEENKGAAKLAKVLALAQIAINTGKAISNMMAEESKKGLLGIATTAAGVAEVLANMASAISLVKSAKFAKGAVDIMGPGTSTSDSIPARISKGESVINARATDMFAPLLMAMNDIGNGVHLPRPRYILPPDQMTDLKEGLIEAYADIRPVVDVQEITRVQRRVEVIQNLDSF